MCSGNPHRNSLQGSLQIYNQSWQKCQLNPCGSTLKTPSKSRDQLPARPFPQQVYHQVHPAHRRATARVLVLLVMKYAALKCVLDRSQLRAFIFGANPSSQPGNLDSWMLSDFKIKLPTVGEKNLVSENHLPFRASRIHCFHIQDLSYCSNAFGSAVKVQIEMLKLVTEKKKNTCNIS